MALILGVNYLTHDGCFCLVRDGQLLAVYEVERFNFTKLGREVEPKALDALLADHDVTRDQLDYVSFPYHPSYLKLRYQQTRQIWQDTPWQANQDIKGLEWLMESSMAALGHLVGDCQKIKPVRHHLAHLAGVFYPSGFQNAAVLSVDGIGEAESTLIATCEDRDINILRNNQFPNSLGYIYYAVTEWLGWGIGEEGKTMALAPYGEPVYLETFLDQYISLQHDGFFECKNFPTPKAFLTSVFGPARSPNDPLDMHHKNMAASVQALTTEIMLRLARYTRKIADSDTLIVTGGVALNSVANGQILKEKLFERLVAYPHANDTGVAIGGAYWLEREYGHTKDFANKTQFRGAYWGREIDKENVLAMSQQFGLSHEIVKDVGGWAAKRLAEGKIVGWIQGRSELGPRALGNRSILASALMVDAKDRINEKIKNRELWRPFAPSVLEEDVSQYFVTDQELPYMIIVADVRESWKEKLAAVSHVDGTARVQSVSKTINPKYHALLQALKRHTGVGMVLNTSFNDRGEPIVNTVEQALRLFLRSDMDCLVIDDFVFETKPVDGRDRTPFSGFIYTVPKQKAVPVFISYCDFGASLERYASFFTQAQLHYEKVILDCATIQEEALLSILGQDGLPKNWSLGEEPPENGGMLLLGAEYSGFWLVRKAICCSDQFQGFVSRAAKKNIPIQGVDCNGGFTDLSFVSAVRYDTIKKLQ